MHVDSILKNLSFQKKLKSRQDICRNIPSGTDLNAFLPKNVLKMQQTVWIQELAMRYVF